MELFEEQKEALSDILRVQKYTSAESETIDARISGLGLAKTVLGTRAIESIILGLSRPIKPTYKDAEKLISEWKQENRECCFTGSVDDLFSVKDTIIVAISYRHDERAEKDNTVFKLTKHDQQAFVQSIVGLGKHKGTSAVMVWCDRVIAIRLRERINVFAWYNAGLLPFACLPVLTLSNHIPDEKLEERIWIKAERSLGRLGEGLVCMNDARRGILSNIHSKIALLEGLKSVSLLILSRYWPKDTGVWATDYHEMKEWALALVCRSHRLIWLPLFEPTRPLDNIEILSKLHKLAIVPRGVTAPERPFHTEDKYFYLKATAWNLSLEELWSQDNSSLSHYLSTFSNCRFSWWRNWSTGTMFGFLVTTENRACTVVALQRGEGFNVFRCEGDTILYRHKEPVAGADTKRAITQAIQKLNLNIPQEVVKGLWGMVFGYDESRGTERTDKDVKSEAGDCCSGIDTILPVRFIGVTTCLFRSVGPTSLLKAEKFVSLFDSWNDHVKRKYDNWIAIRDTLSGPVWLEGYDEYSVSFGFLDYLTRSFVISENSMRDTTIKLPTK